jgi:hypothetical protein
VGILDIMANKTSGSKDEKETRSPSQLIDGRIKELADWRGDALARIRTLIKQADPDVVEEWKWRGVRCGRTTESSARVRHTRTT